MLERFQGHFKQSAGLGEPPFARRAWRALVLKLTSVGLCQVHQPPRVQSIHLKAGEPCLLVLTRLMPGVPFHQEARTSADRKEESHEVRLQPMLRVRPSDGLRADVPRLVAVIVRLDHIRKKKPFGGQNRWVLWGGKERREVPRSRNMQIGNKVALGGFALHDRINGEKFPQIATEWIGDVVAPLPLD